MTKKRRHKRLDEGSQKSDALQEPLEIGATVRVYQEKSGDVPFLGFIATLSQDSRASVVAAVELLRQRGHLLRPPHNEHLGDQIYYLRVPARDGTYRVFYWPFGKGFLVLGHGFSKKTQQCPPEEIKRAAKMRDRFRQDPEAHTYPGE